MNKENINVLTQIYNTLLNINTKGEDTIAMSVCLQSLYALIVNLNNQGEKVIEE